MRYFKFFFLLIFSLSILISCSNENNEGLTFRKSSSKNSGNYLLNYSLNEQIGTIFEMRNESRYKWKHGIKHNCITQSDNGFRLSLTYRAIIKTAIKKRN